MKWQSMSLWLCESTLAWPSRLHLDSGVAVGVNVGVAVGVDVGVAVGVSVTVGVAVAVAMAVGAGVGVEVGIGVTVGVGVGVGVGVATITDTVPLVAAVSWILTEKSGVFPSTIASESGSKFKQSWLGLALLALAVVRILIQ